ncbi:MAG: hypothetical protein ABWZ78_02570 [Burkholderiaceae bacterium]
MDNQSRTRNDVARAVIFAIAVIASVAYGKAARAVDLGSSDIETRFSAKIAKERTRQATLQGLNDRRDRRDRNSELTDSECGSQNIGNLNTNGRIGSQPREVFVFAPNSVNVVTRGGCR